MSILVRDVMQSKPITVSPSETVFGLERGLIENRIGGFPVVEDGKLIGIACRSDIVRALGYEHTYAEQLADQNMEVAGEHGQSLSEKNWAKEVGSRVGERLEGMKVRDVMIRDVCVARPDDTVEAAAKQMATAGFHRLPIVDEGRLVGILTSLDLTRLIAEGRYRAV
ncbi:MAG: CBS domain-containing protein [bacterium]|nr:CBS domain-containing protein [bacterium]